MKIKRNIRIYLYIAFGVALFALLMNLGSVGSALDNILSVFSPVIVGLLAAFILNVPVRGFEKLFAFIHSKSKKSAKITAPEKLFTVIGLLLTLIILGGIIAFTVWVVVPAITTSVNGIVPLIKERAPVWEDFLKNYGIDTSKITEWISNLSVDKILGSTGSVIKTIVKHTTTVISGVTSAGLGLVIAVYIIIGKKRLYPQFRKLVYAYIKKSAADKIYHISHLASETYSKFLSGQCVEAIILGTLIFITFTILGLPYAAVTGLLTGLFAFVPYIGAAASCIIGAFFIFVVDPKKALIAVIAYVIVQFIENQFIYPRVVGSSVGLDPLWTLLAALIGGKIFGVIGMILFIPFSAVLYTLVKEETEKRLKTRKIKSYDDGAQERTE